LIDADILAKLMFFVKSFIFSLRILKVDGRKFENCIVSTAIYDDKIIRLPTLFFTLQIDVREVKTNNGRCFYDPLLLRYDGKNTCQRF